MLVQPSSVLKGVLMATGAPLLKSSPALKPKGQKWCCACAEQAKASSVQARKEHRMRIGVYW